MALCRDKAVRELNGYGYDVVRMPRPDIAPLDVIVESKGLFCRLSPLEKLWKSSEALPVSTTYPAADLKTVESSELRGKFGIRALLDLIGGVGIHAAANHAKSIQLIAMEPIIVTCNHADIENYVTKGDINSENVSARHFYDDTEHVYLITEVIASDKLKIRIGAETGAEAEAVASELTETISGEVEIGTAKFKDNEIVYEREQPAVFGFKSAEILYDGRWYLDFPKMAGKKFLGKKTDAEIDVRVPNARLNLLDGD